MSDLKNVDRQKLQQAFAVAHRGASNMNVNQLGRKHLRAIARLIWESCGDDGAYKNRLDPDVEYLLTLTAQETMEA